MSTSDMTSPLIDIFARALANTFADRSFLKAQFTFTSRLFNATRLKLSPENLPSFLDSTAVSRPIVIYRAGRTQYQHSCYRGTCQNGQMSFIITPSVQCVSTPKKFRVKTYLHSSLTWETIRCGRATYTKQSAHRHGTQKNVRKDAKNLNQYNW